uniref:G-protein coupled receptors family 1 profile domain-containing protein n=2 Tax=Globodera TaxID=31242 RepID=A0A914HF09_GLORO
MNFTVTVLTTLATTATVANAHAATTAPVDVPQPTQLDFVDGDALSRLDDNDYAREVAAKPLADAAKEQLRQFMAHLDAIQKPEYTDVLPPPNHDDVQVQVMAIGYMLLFLLGTCGNVAVLTMVTTMVRSRRAHLDNTLIYMVVLSCVDFGVCLSLPFTVIDQILGFWMFGSTMCKLHAVLENFGKILSALIITAMSFDRFAGVCLSHIRWLRSRRLAIGILIGMAIYALVALCPLLLNFKAREVILFQKETGPNKITRMRIEKCTMVEMSAGLFTLFTCFLFVLCYMIPLFLVTFFYTKLLSKLHQHARQFKTTQFRSQIPLMRISLYTLAVACFYFLCWTPFWVATAFAVYLEYAGEQNGAVPPVFVYCMYFIHALPFTNSAVNWIIYGAMNGQLQQRIRQGGVSTNNAALTTLSMAMCRMPQPQPDSFPDRAALMNGNSSALSTIAMTSSNGGYAGSGVAQQLPSNATAVADATSALRLKAYGTYRHSSCSMEVSLLNDNDRTCCNSPDRSITEQRQYSLSSTLTLVTGHQRQHNSSTFTEAEKCIGEVGAVQQGASDAQNDVVDVHQGVRDVQKGADVEEHGVGAILQVVGDELNETETNWTSLGSNAFDADDEAVLEQQALLLLHSSDSMDLLLHIDSQSTTYL